MTTRDAEIWLESAFERAAAGIALPAEERWIPEDRSSTASSTWATVLVAAALMIAIGLSARVIGQTVRPNGSAVSTASAEETAWQHVAADAPAWMPILRPIWLPSAVRDEDARCGPAVRGAFSHPAGSIADVRAGVAGYNVIYHPDATAGTDCPRVRVSVQVNVVDGNPAIGASSAPHSNEVVDREVTALGTVGTLVRPREDETELRFILGRGPFVYRVQAIGLSEDEFLRVIGSLEVVQR